MHYLATCWFPFTVAMSCSVWNLTLTCNVDGIAPIVWIHGLPRMAVYGENELTTMKVTITSFLSIFTGSEICPSGTTIRPSNPTKGVSYLDKSSFFRPSPLNRSEIHHFGFTSLVRQYSLHYKTVYSGHNHQRIIMRLGRSFQIFIVKGNGSPTIVHPLHRWLLIPTILHRHHGQHPLPSSN